MEYVHAGIKIEDGSALKFYKGFDLGWYPIAQNLDVHRFVADKLLLDVVLADESEHPSRADLFVVKGPAGSGKSVLLRRLAWEAATSADRLAPFHSSYRSLDVAAIRELLQVVMDARVFLFVDNLAENASEVDQLLGAARRQGARLTIVGAETDSNWELYCERLNDLVNDTYQVRALSEKEVARLVDLLELHGCLGARLERMSRDERIAEFVGPADRHLLVALHQATLGEPLEVIVEREFRSLKPKAAQELYMTVCVLNRLGVRESRTDLQGARYSLYKV